MHLLASFDFELEMIERVSAYVHLYINTFYFFESVYESDEASACLLHLENLVG
jgi:hypothetical protein